MNIVKSEIVSKKFYVRYMLSLRCKRIVSEELKKLETKYTILPFGAIEFSEGIEQKKVITLKRNLQKSGLDLLNLHESFMIDKIISTINEVIHDFDDLPNLSYSEIISKNLRETDESVLKIFTEVVGMSVIQFIVYQKVEKIKEYLLYTNFSIQDMSERLNYKSEQYLIAQFKKYTGLTPAHYRKLKEERAKIKSQCLLEANERKSFKNSPAG